MQVWTWDGWGNGTFDIAFPFGTNVINRHSRCIVSICELGGQPLDFPFIGAATMREDVFDPQAATRCTAVRKFTHLLLEELIRD